MVRPHGGATYHKSIKPKNHKMVKVSKTNKPKPKSKQVKLSSNTTSLPVRQKAQLPRNNNKGHRAHGPAVKQVCSMVNPFCEEALGARYADAAASRSLPYTLRGSATVITGAGGGGATFVKVTAAGIYVNQTTGATDAAQTTAAAWTALANFPAGWNESRITSWGVRATVIAPVNTSSGVMKVVSMADPPTVSTIYNTTTFEYPKIEIGPCAPGATATWISKTMNPRQARAFLPAPATSTGNTLDAEQSGWQTFGIFVNGAAASSNPVYLEVVAHGEFTLNATSALYPYAHPAPTPAPALVQAADHIVSTSPQTHFNKTSEAIDGWFAQAATVALSTAGKWVAENGISGIAEMVGGLFV